MSKEIIKKGIDRKMKVSIGLIGTFASLYCSHLYFSKNQPDLIRKLYFDKFFNRNEDPLKDSNFVLIL